MLIDCTNIHIVQGGHHFLCQPYIFILIAHLNTVLLITNRGNIGQVFRCAGTDSYLIFFFFNLISFLLLSFFIVLPAHPLPLEYTHYIILQILCQFSKTLYSSYLAFLHAHNKAGTAFRANHIRSCTS